jgi:hypothetical protein
VRREAVFTLTDYKYVSGCPMFLSNSRGVLFLSAVNRKRLLAHPSLLKLKNEIVRGNHSSCSVNTFKVNYESSLVDLADSNAVKPRGNNKFLE